MENREVNFGLLFPSHQKKIRLLKDFCNIYIIETKDFLVIIPLNNILQEGFYFMKRKYVLLIGGSIIVGGILWSLFRPEKLFIDKQVNEALPQTEIQSNKTKQQEERVISTGQFQNGVHETTGTATIHQLGEGKRVLRLSNFSTSNGPDVRVVLVPTNRLKNNEDVKNHQYIELGKLKGNKGDQNYEIPEGIDVSTYGSVSIWCKRFNENFGAAYFEK
ncbi:DM13 domain-containing protein [Bacillus sp. IT-79MI2]